MSQPDRGPVRTTAHIRDGQLRSPQPHRALPETPGVPAVAPCQPPPSRRADRPAPRTRPHPQRTPTTLGPPPAPSRVTRPGTPAPALHTALDGGSGWSEEMPAGEVRRRYRHSTDGDVALLADVETGVQADIDRPFVLGGDAVDQGPSPPMRPGLPTAASVRSLSTRRPAARPAHGRRCRHNPASSCPGTRPAAWCRACSRGQDRVPQRAGPGPTGPSTQNRRLGPPAGRQPREGWTGRRCRPSASAGAERIPPACTDGWRLTP